MKARPRTCVSCKEKKPHNYFHGIAELNCKLCVKTEERLKAIEAKRKKTRETLIRRRKVRKEPIPFPVKIIPTKKMLTWKYGRGVENGSVIEVEV